MVQRLRSVPLWRWAVLYVLLAAWLMVTAAVLGDRIAARRGLLGWVDLDPLLAPPVWLATGALYLGAALAFTLGYRERLAGAFLFAWLGVTGLAEMGVRGDFMPPLANLLGGNLVLAWLLGSALPGADDARARRGHAAMCGVFAAMLTLAGGSKLVHSGLGWFDGGMHALWIWERAQPLVAPEPVRDLRLWLSARPDLVAVGATYTLLVECLGGLFVFERLRKPMALALLLMFTSMNLALGLGEQGWVAVPMALAWSRPGPPPR